MGMHQKFQNRYSINCYLIYLSMSDSVLDFPDEEFKPRKSKEVQYQRPNVIIKQSIKKSPYYFDKKKFDYHFMFQDVERVPRSPKNQEILDNNFQKSRTSEKVSQKSKQSRSIRQDSQSQKSHKIQHQERVNILNDLKTEEEIEDNQVKEVSMNMDESLSNLSNHQPSNVEGNPNQTQQIENSSIPKQPSNFDEPSKMVEQLQAIESSQIQNLCDDFGESGIKDQQQESSIAIKKQEQISGFQKQPNFHKNEIEIQGSLEISSIKPHTEGEEIIKLLDHFNEKDSDGDEQQNKQEHGQRGQRQAKIQEMESLQFSSLVYLINTINCRKIFIKSMVDFDESILKITKPRPVSYLSIQQRKLQISAYEVQKLRWQIANAKIQLEPRQLTLKCYSCGTKCKGVIVVDRQCMTLCTNSDCTKQITIEFVEISLSPGSTD